MAGRHYKSPESVTDWLHQRQTRGVSVSLRFSKHCCMTPVMVQRLGLFTQLESHTGCVNCLQWNKSGSMLASGSDDKTIIVWDGVTFSRVSRLATPHEGNIFSVVWLPGSDDNLLATGAGDCRVCVLDLERGTALRHITGHQGRVKRLSCAGDNPGIVWSGGEDGLVKQWDIRERWSEENNNIIVNLNEQMYRNGPEVKCITMNPTRSELLAVGANDPYVRLYDRRMISSSPGARGTGAVAYFVPGHLPGAELKFQRSLRPLASTYITYNADGTELLCNLGGEQVYLYDRWALSSTTSSPLTMAVIQSCDKSSKNVKNGHNGVGSSSVSVPTLSQKVEDVKLSANGQFEAGNYNAAVSEYNRALHLQGSSHPILCGNRAAALMKRGWDGDVFAALRDCLTALSLDPGHVKAHLRLAQCLLTLEWTSQADQCLSNFRSRHPDLVMSKSFTNLVQELVLAKEKMKPKSGKSRGSSSKKTSPMLDQYSALDFLVTNEVSEEDDKDSSDDDEDVEDVEFHSDEDQKDFKKIEVDMKKKARDYSVRFVGHCNTTTDIKEANFLGPDGQYIMAGSDDGKFFIWNRKTTNIEKILVGDESIVNCLQSHPFAPVLASSGIDPVVRIWQPLPEVGVADDRVVEDMEAVAVSNQRRMNADPFETILMGMGFRTNDEAEDVDFEDAEGSVQCRPS